MNWALEMKYIGFITFEESGGCGCPKSILVSVRLPIALDVAVRCAVMYELIRAYAHFESCGEMRNSSNFHNDSGQ